MINPQWLELPISKRNFHGPKDVRVIEVRLYLQYDPCGYFIKRVMAVDALRKHAYSNILKSLQPKNENFQIKNSDIFHVCSKHRLWILVRTASTMRF